MKSNANKSVGSTGSPSLTNSAASTLVTKKVDHDEIVKIRSSMQATHDSAANLSYKWRIRQLDCMHKMLTENWSDLQDALYQDLGKEPSEAASTELIQVQNEIKLVRSNLRSWMRAKKAASPSVLVFARTVIEPRPLSAPACLIIGSFNYPVLLVLQPAVGCLAAGNPAVIKPSELCPATSALLCKLVAEYFDEGVMRVVQGGADVCTALLENLSWGLVFFTGSQRVGKIIAAAAASTLSPTVLELGGKAPCYVDESAPSNLLQVAMRIMFGKLTNAGQTCVAVDTLIVHEKVAEKLIAKLVEALDIQYGTHTANKQVGVDNDYGTISKAGSELGRMVQQSYAQRQYDMIEEAEADALSEKSPTRIVCGGSALCDVNTRYIEPTFIVNPSSRLRLMQEEIFGPILPIVIVSSRDEAINHIRNKMDGTPLCMYIFTTNSSVLNKFKIACPAAAIVRNDCMAHMTSSYFPFGGLGSSGYGKYHGRYSFETFSYYQPVFHMLCAPGTDVGNLRYHPYNTNNGNKLNKGNLLLASMNTLPDIPNLHLPIVGGILFIALVSLFTIRA